MVDPPKCCQNSLFFFSPPTTKIQTVGYGGATLPLQFGVKGVQKTQHNMSWKRLTGKDLHRHNLHKKAAARLRGLPVFEPGGSLPCFASGEDASLAATVACFGKARVAHEVLFRSVCRRIATEPDLHTAHRTHSSQASLLVSLTALPQETALPLARPFLSMLSAEAPRGGPALQPKEVTALLLALPALRAADTFATLGGACVNAIERNTNSALNADLSCLLVVLLCLTRWPFLDTKAGDGPTLADRCISTILQPKHSATLTQKQRGTAIQHITKLVSLGSATPPEAHAMKAIYVTYCKTAPQPLIVLQGGIVLNLVESTWQSKDVSTALCRAVPTFSRAQRTQFLIALTEVVQNGGKWRQYTGAVRGIVIHETATATKQEVCTMIAACQALHIRGGALWKRLNSMHGDPLCTHDTVRLLQSACRERVRDGRLWEGLVSGIRIDELDGVQGCAVVTAAAAAGVKGEVVGRVVDAVFGRFASRSEVHTLSPKDAGQLLLAMERLHRVVPDASAHHLLRHVSRLSRCATPTELHDICTFALNAHSAVPSLWRTYAPQFKQTLLRHNLASLGLSTKVHELFADSPS